MNKFYLEQMKLGELDSNRICLLKQNPNLESELKALEDSDTEILSRYPATMMADLIEKRMKEEKQSEKIIRFDPSRRTIIPILSVAAALILFTVSLPFVVSRFSKTSDDGMIFETTRIKGVGRPDIPTTPILHIYRNTDDKAEELKDKAPATNGDRLQISYYAPTRIFGAIFSLDGNDLLTMHYPEKGREMVSLEQGHEILLPWAYELDDAPCYETFLLIYAKRPISVSVLSEVIRSEKNPSKIESRLVSLYGQNEGIGVYSVQITKR